MACALIAHDVDTGRELWRRSSVAGPDDPPEPYPSMHPLLVTPERDWVPDAESLKYFGRGLSQRQIAAVQETEQALSVAFYAEPGDMLRVRALSMQIMAAVVTKTGGLLWDDETRGQVRAAFVADDSREGGGRAKQDARAENRCSTVDGSTRYTLLARPARA